MHCARKMTPEHDYIFYADTEHVPYGEKTVEQVREYVDHIIFQTEHLPHHCPLFHYIFYHGRLFLYLPPQKPLLHIF